MPKFTPEQVAESNAAMEFLKAPFVATSLPIPAIPDVPSVDVLVAPVESLETEAVVETPPQCKNCQVQTGNLPKVCAECFAVKFPGFTHRAGKFLFTDTLPIATF